MDIFIPQIQSVGEFTSIKDIIEIVLLWLREQRTFIVHISRRKESISLIMKIFVVMVGANHFIVEEVAQHSSPSSIDP